MPPDASAEDRARGEALARLLCPACLGLLVPEVPEPGAASRGDPPVTCLDCGACYAWVRGVLDLTTPSFVAPPPRTYPAGGRQLDFFGFFVATLATRAYADTDLEDELYTLFGWLDLPPDVPVAALGADSEDLLAALAGAFPGSTVLALSDDLDASKRARVGLLRRGIASVVQVRTDVATPPLRPSGLDGLLHVGLLHGLPDPTAHLRRLGGALTVGGRLAGVTLARSTLPQIAVQQDALGARAGLRFVPMETLARDLMGHGWASLRHEQPSNWMARFVAVRAPG